MANGRGRPAGRRKQMERPALLAANDNASRTEVSIGAGAAKLCPRGSAPKTANDGGLTTAPSRAANDNAIAAAAPPVPANDNDIRVTDDFPRPLPVMPGEADLVRTLLGKRFRQILQGEKP